MDKQDVQWLISIVVTVASSDESEAGQVGSQRLPRLFLLYHRREQNENI